MLTPSLMTHPLQALAARPEGGLAVITAGSGGFRPRGAMLALWADGSRWGSVSSGCIEDDIAHHWRALPPGGRARLRYGKDSPWPDLRLPCGGALEVTLFAAPPPALLGAVTARLAARQPSHLLIPPEGAPHLAEPGPETLAILPAPRCLVAGDNANLGAFIALARASGIELAGMGVPGLPVLALDEVAAWLDPYSAMILFFHDHDREIALLRTGLRSRAFLVGAQGSRAAHVARSAALTEAGLSAPEIARLAAPLGIIGPARDSVLMASSALTDLLWRYQQAQA